jgi:hypothetical protein
MNARAEAVQRLVEEACRAVAFGRADIVVIADREIIRQLPQMLTDALRGDFDAVSVRIAGQQDSVADCVAAAITAARQNGSDGKAAKPRARDPESPKARMVLLLPDALAIPKASLRSLHTIANLLDAHRLVLLVDRDSTSIEDPTHELGARLGVGVSKIELKAKPSDPSASQPGEDSEGPRPAAAPAKPARPRAAPTKLRLATSLTASKPDARPPARPPAKPLLAPGAPGAPAAPRPDAPKSPSKLDTVLEAMLRDVPPDEPPLELAEPRTPPSHASASAPAPAAPAPVGPASVAPASVAPTPTPTAVPAAPAAAPVPAPAPAPKRSDRTPPPQYADGTAPRRTSWPKRALRWTATAAFLVGLVIVSPDIIRYARQVPPMLDAAFEAAARVRDEAAEQEQASPPPVVAEPETAPAEEPTPAPEVVAAVPAAAPKPAPVVPPAPVRPKPAPVRPKPAPVPKPAPARPKPAPVRPKPAAVRPKPAPKPAPARVSPPARPVVQPGPAVGVNLNAVPWAELEIDGRKVGPTPIANLRLSAGSHEVRAVFPDGRVSVQTIQVEPRSSHFQIFKR